MKKHTSGWISGALSSLLALSTLLAAVSSARADLGACGDISVEAKAQCEVVPPGVECDAMCTPISVRAACAGQLAVDCRAQCNHLPSVSCEGSCQGSCEADCSKLDPGSFDCRGSCQLDCTGRCAGNCSASDDKASCEAACKGSCAASCDASCTAHPPQADCKASCEGSCQGSCEVDPNLDCQATCQAKGRVSCEADLEGGCKAQCKKQDGALFCSGAYVDNGDNLQECVAALRAVLGAHVTAQAQGSSSCDAGTCSAQGSASIKTKNCSVQDPGTTHGPGIVWLLSGFASLLVLRRRRDRRCS